MTIPVITIDGPAAAGKGTAARLTAAALGWHFLESGRLYRALGLLAARQNIFSTAAAAGGKDGEFSAKDEEKVAALAAQLDSDEALLDKLLKDDELDGEGAGESASLAARMPKARAALLDLQRRRRRPPGLVAEGRDMGTRVFEDAALKIFLTASLAARAARRAAQGGGCARIEQVRALLAARDARDSSRASSPLLPPRDAVVLDATALSAQQTAERILSLYSSSTPSTTAGVKTE